jgi:hypothetical protein
VGAEGALHLAVAAAVSLLVPEAAIKLRGGVPLLGRRILVVGEDLVDDRVKRPQHGGGSVSGLWSGLGLRIPEDIPDRVARMIEVARDLPNGHAIAPHSPNSTVVVHRKHVL